MTTGPSVAPAAAQCPPECSEHHRFEPPCLLARPVEVGSSAAYLASDSFDYEDENGSSHVKPCPQCGAATDESCADDCPLVTGTDTDNRDPSLDLKMMSGWPVAGVTLDPGRAEHAALMATLCPCGHPYSVHVKQRSDGGPPFCNYTLSRRCGCNGLGEPSSK